MNPLTIDKQSTALVLIDLQHGIVSLPVAPHASHDVVQRAARLASAFRSAGSPVVLVRVANLPGGQDTLKPITDGAAAAPSDRPPQWSEFVPELGQQPSDIVVTKRQWGAFFGTELDLQLRRRGVSTIVLAGIATHIGVESTARDAYERSYQQVFVEDATSSPSAEAHANSFKFVFPRMGRVRSASQVLEALGGA